MFYIIKPRFIGKKQQNFNKTISNSCEIALLYFRQPTKKKSLTGPN